MSRPKQGKVPKIQKLICLCGKELMRTEGAKILLNNWGQIADACQCDRCKRHWKLSRIKASPTGTTRIK